MKAGRYNRISYHAKIDAFFPEKTQAGQTRVDEAVWSTGISIRARESYRQKTKRPKLTLRTLWQPSPRTANFAIDSIQFLLKGNITAVTIGNRVTGY